jgi:REP element-mobilizing transposase RayT
MAGTLNNGSTRDAQPRRDRKGALAKDIQKTFPLAYLITFTCYGARLHGDESGSVSPEHNLPGSAFLSPNRALFKSERKEMKQAPYQLGGRQRLEVLQTLQSVCIYRGWLLLAAHVRSSHVHLIVSADEAPEKVMNDIKAYASRALNQTGREGQGRRRWARHGSTRYLWKPEAVGAAIEYVIREQGEPMAVWENPQRAAW